MLFVVFLHSRRLNQSQLWLDLSTTIPYFQKCGCRLRCDNINHSSTGHVRTVVASERRRYICIVFSHWLKPIPNCLINVSTDVHRATQVPWNWGHFSKCSMQYGDISQRFDSWMIGICVEWLTPKLNDWHISRVNQLNDWHISCNTVVEYIDQGAFSVSQVRVRTISANERRRYICFLGSRGKVSVSERRPYKWNVFPHWMKQFLLGIINHNTVITKTPRYSYLKVIHRHEMIFLMMFLISRAEPNILCGHDFQSST